MELTGEVVNAAVVAAVGFLVWWGTRGQVKALRDDMNGRFEQVDRRLGELSAEIGQVRSDLTRVALAVGAGPSSERGAG